MTPTLRRLIDITYQERLSHLSSTLSALPIIEEIYQQKQPDEVFILSNGHAGLALYVVLEKYYGVDPVMLLHKHGIHPGRDLENHLYCSTGSLGSGLPIAVGHALARPDKNVWVMISDGECAEGSIWEALRYINDRQIKNLHVYVNINGMGAYDEIDRASLDNRLKSFLPRINIRHSDPTSFTFASGLLTHYYVLKEQDYLELTQ
jgi:transketolase N-terminal domain/subunit